MRESGAIKIFSFKVGELPSYLQCQSLRRHLGSRSTHTKGQQWSDALLPLSL